MCCIFVSMYLYFSKSTKNLNKPFMNLHFVNRILILFLISFIGVSCQKKNEIEKKIEKMPRELEVVRFDQILYETPIDEFQSVRAKFPQFFSSQMPDSFYTNKLNNKDYQNLYRETKKLYHDISDVEEEIKNVLKRLDLYVPDVKQPDKLTTVISEVDYQSKFIYTDSVMILSLDMYLGKDHKFYEFPDYFEATFVREQMLPDMVTALSEQLIAYPTDRTFLAQIIHHGKRMYMMDLLLPDYPDHVKMAYTKEQLTWCQDNEKDMWRYFIEKNHLYDSDPRLTTRFITPAPFSKFYIGFDNETPGRVGVWLGWQIVRSFVKHNKDVSLQDLIKMSGKDIFDKSKYKPNR